MGVGVKLGAGGGPGGGPGGATVPLLRLPPKSDVFLAKIPPPPDEKSGMIPLAVSS